MYHDLFNKPNGRTALVLSQGFVLDLASPDATGMPVEVIAKSLSVQPRWCGASETNLTVAQHSVMVSKLVPPEFAYAGLMHDCEEAILGDWPTPIKELLGRDYLKEKLAPIKSELRRWFGFDEDVPEVKHADLVCMATELRDVMPPHWMEWGHLPAPHHDKISPESPERAFQMFMERYEEVKHQRVPVPNPKRKALR